LLAVGAGRFLSGLVRLPPKYQSEGGPGMDSILERFGREQPSRRGTGSLCTRADDLLWLIGATDGHAKELLEFSTTPRRRVSCLHRFTMFFQLSLSSIRAVKAQPPTRLAMSAGDNKRYQSEKLPLLAHFGPRRDAAGLPKGSVEVFVRDF